MTTAAGVVSAMQDQSGNAWDLAASVTPDYLASDAAYGGKPSVLFQADGTGPYLESADGIAASIAGPTTLIVIGHHSEANPSNNYGVMTKSGAAWGCYAGSLDTDWIMYATPDTPDTLFDATTAGVNVFVFDQATSRAYHNAKTPRAVVLSAAVAITTGIRLGNWQAPIGDTFTFGGRMTRVLIYAGALAQPDVEAALVGLGALYGIGIGP